MFTDQQIIDRIDQSATATYTPDAHAVTESLLDEQVASGELDVSELELAWTETEKKVQRILDGWHK